jgi:hypothetical protein
VGECKDLKNLLVEAAKKEVARSAKKKGLMQAARKENMIPVTPCPQSKAAIAATPDQGEGGADGEAREKVVDTGVKNINEVIPYP